jgi:hypothetical protein
MLDQLLSTIETQLSGTQSNLPAYDWPVTRSAWAKLSTGFDHSTINDPAQLNIALRQHLKECWSGANDTEKLRLANWIIADWGGIKRNDPFTIEHHVARALATKPATPFKGISSYSEIFAVRDPEQYAIYDSRVASALNAIQVIQCAESRDSTTFLAFPCPSSQNKTIKEFCDIYSAKNLVSLFGFQRIAEDDAYETYMNVVHALRHRLQSAKSTLEIEMELFAKAECLCKTAIRLRKQHPAIKD